MSSELRFNKKSPYVYIRWRENGHRFEKSTGILKTDKITIRQFQHQFDQELAIKKKRLHDVRFDKGKATLQEAWTHYLQNNSGKDPHTIKEYKTFFIKLNKDFPPNAPCYIINKLSAEKFLNSVRVMKYAGNKKQYSQNTKYNICKNFRKFLSHLFEYEYIKPIFMLNKNILTRQKVNDVLVFAPGDLNLILQLASEKNLKFKTLIYFLAYSGLRPSDLLHIKKQDILLDEGMFRYYSQKNDVWKHRPIHNDFIPVLKARLSELKPEDLIFGYKELHYLGTAFRRLIHKKLDKKGYSLRTFRKSFMNSAYNNNISAEDVSDLVGNSLGTAKTYYRKFSSERLKNELSKVNIGGISGGISVQ